MVLEIIQVVVLWVLVFVAIFGWLIGRKISRDQFLSERKLDLLGDFIQKADEAVRLVGGLIGLEKIDWESKNLKGIAYGLFETGLPFHSREMFDYLLEPPEREEDTEGETGGLDAMKEYALDLKGKAFFRFLEVSKETSRIITDLRLLHISEVLGGKIVEVMNGIGAQAQSLGQETLLTTTGFRQAIEVPDTARWLEDMARKMEALKKTAEKEIGRSLSVWRIV